MKREDSLKMSLVTRSSSRPFFIKALHMESYLYIFTKNAILRDQLLLSLKSKRVLVLLEKPMLSGPQKAGILTTIMQHYCLI